MDDFSLFSGVSCATGLPDGGQKTEISYSSMTNVLHTQEIPLL